jgi:hypothetical protein
MERFDCRMTHTKVKCLRKNKEKGETRNAYLMESVNLEDQNRMEE